MLWNCDQLLMQRHVQWPQTEVTAFQEDCSKDLAAAEPIIKEAEAALNSLDKASLGELKSFSSPAAEVVAVVSACMTLTAPNGKIPKVISAQVVALPGPAPSRMLCKSKSLENEPLKQTKTDCALADIWLGCLVVF
jgi:hypothetical protein